MINHPPDLNSYWYYYILFGFILGFISSTYFLSFVYKFSNRKIYDETCKKYKKIIEGLKERIKDLENDIDF